MIRWITDHIGTAPYNSNVLDRDFSVVDVRDLVDGIGNSSALIKEKINQGISSLSEGTAIVICCDYGISRSNAIAAGIIGIAENISFQKAVNKVIEATRESGIKIELLSQVEKAYEEMVGHNIKTKTIQRKLLITGGTGFIGKKLLKVLDSQINVLSISSKEVDLINDVVGLDSYVKKNSITEIIHLASPRIAATNKSIGDMIVMLKNVLDVCSVNRLKVVFLSGYEIYSGYRTNLLFASEDLPGCPRGVYSEAKFFCEQLLKLYQTHYDVKVALIRSGTIYSVDSDRSNFIINFASKALNNQDIYAHEYLNGHPRLDLLHIKDFINAIRDVITSDFDGCLHLGGGKSYSTTEIAGMLVELLGSKSVIKHRKIDDYCSNIIMKTNKVKRLFGWFPKVSLREGLQDIVREKIFANQV